MDTSASADPSGASPPPPPPPFDPANPPGPRQLRRRPEQGHIAGVCAGVAEYFNVDPVIVRIAAVVLLVSGPGLIAYILAWIFVPEARSDAPIVAPTEPTDAKDRGMQIFGIVLLALAVSVLWGDWWSPSRRWLFPVGLMALGAWLLLRRGDGRPIHQHGSPSHWHGSHWSGRSWGGVHDTGGTTDAAPGVDVPGTAGLHQTGPSSWSASAAGPTTTTGGIGSEPGTADADTETDATVADPTTPLPPWSAATGSTGDDGDGTGRTTPYPWGEDPHGPSGSEAPPCRRRRMLGPAVMGTLLLWAGVAWIAGVTLETSLAVALCIVGIGFVLGAVVGGAWALIAPAVLIGGTLLVISAVDIPLSGPIGDRTWAPSSIEEVEDSYELSIGESTLDLTDVRVDRGETLEIDASVGLGNLTVELPAGVEIEVATRVGAGESNLFGVINDGVSVSDQKVVDGDERSGTIKLDLHVGMGQIEVDQLPASFGTEDTRPN